MKRQNTAFVNSIPTRIFAYLLLICLLPMDISVSFSQNATPERLPPPSSYADLAASMETALQTEKSQINELKLQLKQITDYGKALTTEINAYKVLLSVHSNLLLMPQVQIENIEKAWRENKLAVDSVTPQLKISAEQAEVFGEKLKQIQEQQDLNKKQLSDIRTDASRDPNGKILINKMQSLTDVLVSKQRILKKIYDVYTSQTNELDTTLTSLSELADKFDQQIKSRKKQQLFERRANLLGVLNWSYFKEELQLLSQQFISLGLKPFWQTELRPLWAADGLQAFTFLILLLTTTAGAIRLGFFFRHLRQCYISAERYPWRYIGIKLFQRSLILLGIGLYTYLFAQFNALYATVPIIRTIFLILMILLATRWGLDVLKFSKPLNLFSINETRRRLLRFGLIWVRCFAIVYLCIEWLLGSSGVLLMAWRMFFGISLIVWNLLFWKNMQSQVPPPEKPVSKLSRVLQPLAIRLCYGIMIGGFLIELAGYGSLALYWYTSWGRSAIIGLWALILFHVVREWETEFQQEATASAEKLRKPGYTLKWLFIRCSWFLWGLTLILSLLLAWSAKQAVLVNMFSILKHPFAIGQMNFSLIGLFYAAVILFLTLTSAHLWRYILHERILLYSGLDLGLKDSITTISTYLIWTMGILLSLYAIGLSTTSLVVAFGALGIGLGFGLQTIFNNFISGLILLFERPIQVGDAIEISGVWGTVKKINVRSTLVQTYDNASLIIPNSEFISAQVTNWSFKDQRIRRTITVGVAYGSDVHLVRQSLLEIAETVPDILKQPKPDVLFSDFADSALIFKLRIWALIDNILTVETNIRFAIDRLFREKDIEISFPQCDIHIRSVPDQTKFPQVDES
ncbi:MAG: mechanosensitive ion channel [Desulfobacterales bacterium]|nr:mechanosensitive ion channel [Desulfobacterales bacterium]MDD4072691.1 mechanosensitive ion channel [Desulfobacterales bacterium]MDD4391884.1 mechanosensitive ion channel [Desulfobacterales bacterium]